MAAPVAAATGTRCSLNARKYGHGGIFPLFTRAPSRTTAEGGKGGPA
jgi:hypothetical protein